MLKKIYIKNINSIDVCEIDFNKGSYKFLQDNVNGDIVNPIAIYGHNGSGKSSFMNAISQFISLLSMPAESLVPFVVNNFLFEEGKNKGDSEKLRGSIKLEFELNGDEYIYFLETTRKNYIHEEYLYLNDKLYFNFDGKKYSYKELEYDVSTKTNSKLVPFLRILASSEITDSIIQTVFTYLKSFTHVNVSLINRGMFVTSTLFTNTNIFDLLTTHSDEVKEIFKKYATFPVYSIEKDNKTLPNGLVAAQYNVVLEDGNFIGRLPYQMISTGMQNQSILLSLILSMPKESAMFIDEADIALHPSVFEPFLEIIKKRKIQIVLTLHNTFAMQFLRPDQIYFAKWSKGFSRFYRLSKIYPNIREVNNIEKMYLSTLFDEAIDSNEK